MTVEEIKKEYGDCTDGYIRCDVCPVSHCTVPNASGYDDCWKYIQEYMDEKESTPDNVNHPTHYETGKFECIDVMIETQGIEAVKHFCICNAFKYIYRHGNKNGIEDIKKAIWYLNKYIELEEGGHE